MAQKRIDNLDYSVVEQIAEHYKSILALIGEDVDEKIAEENSKSFDIESNDLVTELHIPCYSMCEHHMMPFFGTYFFAYIPHPQGKILGLSKVARVVDYCAARLQVQERLTKEICNALSDILNTTGVIVYCEAEHLCMKMRGVEKEDSVTSTIEYDGVFSDAAYRQEFFNLLHIKK